MELLKIPHIVFLLVVFVTSCRAGVWENIKYVVNSWSSDDVTKPWPPSFCNSLDCPMYKVIEKTQDYELRHYNRTTNWVSTTISTTDYEEYKENYRRDMFMKLFKYISGANSRKQKIAMTVPVTVFISPGHGPACETNFTMSFFVANSIPNPPTPDNEQVFLSNMAPTKMYVRSFSGYADKDDYMRESQALTSALPKGSYKLGVYFTVGYDAPYKFWDRHNEIWFIATQ